MDNILEVQSLHKRLPGFALADVCFSLPRGYIMGFIGPNGAGKTTTIKLIMNLVRKDAGKIKLFGLDHLRYEKKVKEKIGFVYDENFFYEDLTIQEMKRIVARFYRRWDENRFQQYIRIFGLPAQKKIKDLSRGMRMKFSLALALSHQAELIIMDEPTSGLDPVFRSELLDILAGLLQDGNRSVLFSTHITTDLEKTADYICFINGGKIVFCESKDAVMENYVLVKGGPELLSPETRRLFTGIRETRYGFQGVSNRPGEVRTRLGEKALVEKAGLDDIMLFTIKGEQNHVESGN